MTEESPEPLLSSDETEALLAAMRNGAANSQATKELSLGSTDQRLRESLEYADSVGKDFALELRKLLRRVAGVPHPVHEGNADVVPFNVLSSSLAGGMTIATLKLSGSVVGFMVLGPRMTVRILSRRLGAGVPAVDAPEEAPRNQLSPVDRRIARPFMQETLELFNDFWSKGELAFEIGDILGKPSDVPRLPQFEPLLRLPLTIGVAGDSTEEMWFAVNSTALPAAPQAAPLDAEPEPPAPSEDRARLAARLSHAEVDIVAVLGHAQSTVREILRLRVGDVIRLNEPPDTPVKVSVEGRQKMLGLPVVRHGNLAIEVIEVLKGKP
ncbi:MAG TPA: FliM/FliN family flagellar motor switch protein [Polyangiales bacterium]